MPTARELLEQADALMRRNRGLDPPVPAPPSTDDDIPELVDVAPAQVAAAPAESLPRREALARELTEPPHDSYPLPPTPAGIATLDDIPELTDVVEEIEAPSILDVSGDFDLGEPSVFMEPGHGEVSMLGPWPVAPEVPPAAANGEEGDNGAGSDGEMGVGDFDFEAVGVLHVSPELLAGAADDDPPTELPPEARDATRDDVGVPAEPPWSAHGFLPGAIGLPSAAIVPVAEESRLGELPAATGGDSGPAGSPPASNAAEFSDPGPVVPESTADAAGATTEVVDAHAPDGAHPDVRWDQIAEEIRMQVLQRIDIFTDTGLQAQLAERLQPIVDRASDELVTTINQQVGQLLRAYVAEAIEREIQQWRADHRS